MSKCQNVNERVALWLATGFGLGYMPVASGTFGSLLGLPIAYGLLHAHVLWQVAASATLVVCAVPVCGVAERVLGKKDDGRIVADEWMVLPVSFIGLPAAGFGVWWLVALWWLSTRVFDILKPPPAYQLQRLHGGVGIVIDDFAAALYALAANHFIYWFLVLRPSICPGVS